jgi:hypothetical protein
MKTTRNFVVSEIVIVISVCTGGIYAKKCVAELYNYYIKILLSSPFKGK